MRRVHCFLLAVVAAYAVHLQPPQVWHKLLAYYAVLYIKTSLILGHVQQILTASRPEQQHRPAHLFQHLL